MGTAAEIDVKEVLAFPVGPAAVLYWRTAPTIEVLRATQDLFIEHYKGREMGLLTVTSPGTPPPGPKERSHIVANMRRFGPGMRAAASVIEGEGFGAAAMRAVMTGLNLALRLPYPNRIYASLPEAAHWIHEQFPGAWAGPDALVQAVNRRIQASGAPR